MPGCSVARGSAILCEQEKSHPWHRAQGRWDAGRADKGFEDKGDLSPDQWYEIEITDTRLTVSVDGQMRGEVQGDYSTAAGRIGIGPGFGSTVTVDWFKGVQE